MTTSDASETTPSAGDDLASPAKAPHGVLLTVRYDGGPFSGFARQPNARTVAGELDGAVRAVDARASLVRGASRTDAGVHALGQRVAFDATRELASRNWALALNAQLPAEIAIARVSLVEPGFEPRFRATHKLYRYVLLESPLRDPFHQGRAWRVDPLDHERMLRAATPLLGEHDFNAFRAASDERKDTVRKILRIEVRRVSSDARVTEVLVEGTGFLHRMVRIIVGSLVDVGRGKLDPSALEGALASGERTALGITAPPDGLHLDHVALDDEGRSAWPS
ncbi:MAG TPA: tRNA pseudouridine(38-40) synthase TruA [Polyangiaceae bacterium]|nr:tRNA pseudouridine(38-40) synthase TruA [Polyangiaceae bacterium]